MVNFPKTTQNASADKQDTYTTTVPVIESHTAV